MFLPTPLTPLARTHKITVQTAPLKLPATMIFGLNWKVILKSFFPMPQIQPQAQQLQEPIPYIAKGELFQFVEPPNTISWSKTI